MDDQGWNRKLTSRWIPFFVLLTCLSLATIVISCLGTFAPRPSTSINGIFEPVKVASTTHVLLTGAAAIEIDGVALSFGDRVLLKNQVQVLENGIYVYSSTGFHRSKDMSNAEHVVAGSIVYVLTGDTQAGFTFRCTLVTEGSRGLVFVNVNNYSLGLNHALPNATATYDPQQPSLIDWRLSVLSGVSSGGGTDEHPDTVMAKTDFRLGEVTVLSMEGSDIMLGDSQSTLPVVIAGNVTALGNYSSSGSVSCATLSTGSMSCAALAVIGPISNGTNAMTTGSLQCGAMSSTGAITGASLQVNAGSVFDRFEKNVNWSIIWNEQAEAKTDLKLTLVGNQVTLRFPQLLYYFGDAGNLYTTSILDVRFRPVDTQILCMTIFNNDAYEIGSIQITPTGYITIQPIGFGPFNGGNSGFPPTCVTWTI